MNTDKTHPFSTEQIFLSKELLWSFKHLYHLDFALLLQPGGRLSSDLAGSLAACLLLLDSLCLGAAHVACQSLWGICVLPATWRGCPGCLPPLAQAQQPTMCRRGVIRSGFPKSPLLKLAQTLLLLQPVPEASDKAAPAAAATLIPAKAGGCWELWCGSCVLFQEALLPAPFPAVDAASVHLSLPFISLCMVG